jgi:hypothetical protein
MTLYAKSACNLSAPVDDFDIAEISSIDAMGSQLVLRIISGSASEDCVWELVDFRWEPNHEAELGGLSPSPCISTLLAEMSMVRHALRMEDSLIDEVYMRSVDTCGASAQYTRDTLLEGLLDAISIALAPGRSRIQRC